MKKNFKILSVLFLISIYVFAINVVAKTFFHNDVKTYPTSSQDIVISNYSSSLFCHTSQAESSVNNINNLPVLNFKNLFTSFLAIIKVTEQISEREFSQYSFVLKNFLIIHRKSDHIFPFHYFW